MAKAQARIAESRRLAALSDAVRPERLDLAMLLALEAAKQGDTLEARGSLQRSLDARPEVVRFLHVPEGDVTSVAFGPEGQIAAGYGGVRGVGVGGGVVLFDARGERLRPAPLEVKEGDVTSVAFGPEGQIAAGYGVGGVGGGGVVLFDARGERLRPAPLEVKEGDVTSVAFGPEGKIAAGYARRRRRRRRGALRRPGRAAPTRAAGGQGGRCHERGLRAGGPDRRGIWRRRRRRRGALRRPGRAAPTRAAGGQGGRCHERGLRAGGQIAAGYGGVAAAAWCSSTPASGSDPLEVKEGSQSVAFGRRAIAAGYVGGVVLFDARGERLRPAPLEVKEGGVTSVAFGPEGKIAAGYGVGGGGGGVVLFDARGERLRPAPLEVKEGDVTSVAFGPEGKIAAGYGVGGGGGGVVLFDARGERLRPAPLEVKEGDVRSVAFGPEGKIAAGYARRRRRRRRGALRRPGRAAPTRAAGGQGGRCHERGLRAGGQDRRGIWRRRRRRRRRGALRRPGRAAPTRAAGGQGGRCQERGLRAGGPDRRGISAARVGVGGGVVLFDARGERLRPAPLEVKEGDVTSVAFGPEGQIAAGYGGGVRGGGVVLFDARGERLRPAPLEVKEGDVRSVAFGPEGQIAAGYGGGVASAAWCSSTPGASGSDPRRWRSRRAMSRAWPSGRRASHSATICPGVGSTFRESKRGKSTIPRRMRAQPCFVPVLVHAGGSLAGNESSDACSTTSSPRAFFGADKGGSETFPERSRRGRPSTALRRPETSCFTRARTSPINVLPCSLRA